jgi:hypothetical protein
MKISAFTTPSVSAVTNRLVRRSRRLIPLMGRREIGGIDVDHFQTADLRQRVKRSVLRFAGKVGATGRALALVTQPISVAAGPACRCSASVCLDLAAELGQEKMASAALRPSFEYRS